MKKNILLTGAFILILIPLSVLAYVMLDSYLSNKGKADQETQAHRECAEKINFDYDKPYVYQEYNKCIAKKGLTNFR